jgi:hypothetical protein
LYVVAPTPRLDENKSVAIPMPRLSSRARTTLAAAGISGECRNDRPV